MCYKKYVNIHVFIATTKTVTKPVLASVYTADLPTVVGKLSGPQCLVCRTPRLHKILLIIGPCDNNWLFNQCTKTNMRS